MAFSIIDKPNTAPEDSDYIYGRITDDDGSGDGTPVNTMVYGDFHQFFMRLLDQGNVVPNHLPDNDYNGFQLFEAFLNMITNNPWVNVTPSMYSNSWTSYSFTNPGQGPVRFQSNAAGTKVFLSGQITGGASGTIAFQLPAGLAPKYTVVLSGGMVENTGGKTNSVYIDTSGNVTIYYSSGGGNIYLDGLSFPLN